MRATVQAAQGRSSFGNCTSLRRKAVHRLQPVGKSQFLRELHFIEAMTYLAQGRPIRIVAVPSGTALH